MARPATAEQRRNARIVSRGREEATSRRIDEKRTGLDRRRRDAMQWASWRGGVEMRGGHRRWLVLSSEHLYQPSPGHMSAPWNR